MLAWPSSSCTARRSPLDCSRWLANEWRSMCGCTGVLSPACWLRWRRRAHTDAADRRAPRRPTNSAPSASRAPKGCSRSASQARSAANAARPTGRLRRLLPLPKTWASAASRSIQPRPCWCAAGLAATSRPASSPTRRPQPYSSSTMAASRASTQGSSPGCAKSARRTASSTARALGKGLGALGARRPCAGLCAVSPWRAAQR